MDRPRAPAPLAVFYSDEVLMRIDAHQHFWPYDPGEYAWIDESMQAIRRDFTPSDLAPLLSLAQIDGTVAVQARQTLAETEWLLQLSQEFRWIKGVVGWVPLAREGRFVGEFLDRYSSTVSFKGVRHVLQAEPDSYFSDSRFNAGLDEVAARDLTYDLLVFARQLPAALSLVDRHPSLRIVLDHIAKPVVNGTPSPEWRAAMRELARRQNVSCKFSGVLTEAPGRRWSPECVRPFFDVVLETFGPDRLMFGSDWPVCLVATDYAEWLSLVDAFTAPLSRGERDAILGETAASVYRLTR